MISYSSLLYKKSPPLGRMIGYSNTLNASLHLLIVPKEGVVPPSARLAHNSILSAPPSTADLVVVKSEVAISMMYFFDVIIYFKLLNSLSCRGTRHLKNSAPLVLQS